MNLSWVLTLFFALIGVYMLWKREHFLPDTKSDSPCPPRYVKTSSGDCKLDSDNYDTR